MASQFVKIFVGFQKIINNKFQIPNSKKNYNDQNSKLGEALAGLIRSLVIKYLNL